MNKIRESEFEISEIEKQIDDKIQDFEHIIFNYSDMKASIVSVLVENIPVIIQGIITIINGIVEALPELIKAIVMGHSDIQTTANIYNEVQDQHKQDVFGAAWDKLKIG